MRGGLTALARLLYVQAAWNYERMLGIGLGHASQPLLADLRSVDPARHAEAVARSSEFFNANPLLAGLAAGALARAEHDGVPGAAVGRLRTALCGPLGALGDRLFWAGLVPSLAAAGVIGVTLGAGGWAVAAVVLAYNVVRLAVARWALATGWREGLQVGTAMGRSWLPRAAERVAAPAGFAVGAAVPLVAVWLLRDAGTPALVAAPLLAAGGLVLARAAGPRYSAVRYALVLLGLAFTLGALGR
ncbi:MAG: PTS system mannose/fructose/sorbose family transporter subunit IID [Gemmatimonadales bacterium]|nr:PTS system mannose/fructose/sorbose family transporter subunit IID [Gemmatimonadales bacterium]